MKFLFIYQSIAFILIFCLSLKAQIETFELIDYSSNEEICTHVFELDDFYLICSSSDNVFNAVSSSILKISKSGDFIQEFDLPEHYNFIVLHVANWYNNTLLIDISEPFLSDSSKYKRCILITDHDLNILSEHCYFIIDYQDGYAYKMIDGVYKFIFSVGQFSRGDLCYGSFYEDNTLVVNFKNDKGIPFPSSIDVLPNGNYLIYTVPGIIETDTLFNPIANHFHLNMSIHGTVRSLGGGEMVVVGIDRSFDTMQSGNPVYYKNVIHYLNEDISVIDSDRFDIRDDPTTFNGFNYPAVKQMLDIHEDQIYVASNIEIFGIQGHRRPNRFQILKYTVDDNLERQWQMVFGGDAAYVLWGMIATSDGGCLVYGFKRDDPDDRSYPYVLKVNEDGLISSISGADPHELFAVTIYGNPSTQLRMNIQAPSEWNGIVELHDLSGRLIHRSSADSGIWEQSPTVDLANGVYIVSIKDNTGGYQSFKWIKM
jgi:hypothetical protein